MLTAFITKTILFKAMKVGMNFSWRRKRDTVWESINELDDRIRVNRARRDGLTLRANVPIVVVDDQPFDPANNLRHNHYLINHLSDIQNIDEVKTFPIVLCDLQGVGSKLHAELQGAHLIREIKQHFPEKIVIAYTGIGRNNLMSRAAQQSADTFLKKDADLDEWIDALDGAIRNVTDPVYMWKRFRKRLLDAGMTPFELTRLEDSFVRGATTGRKDDTQQRVLSVVEKLGLQNDLRAVVQGFVSSLIFQAVTASS
jgi:hypothetical protein